MVASPGDRVAQRLRDLVARQPWPDEYACLAALALLTGDQEQGGVSRWAELVLACASTCGGATETAVEAAASAALLMAALDVFDDVEDGEIAPGVDPAAQLNVGTGLLLLFHQACHDSSLHALPAPGMLVLVQAGVRACGGQHRDLCGHAGSVDIGPEEAVAIATDKSAALVAALCRVGALVGDAPAALLAQFAAFGYHLGMALQLANDLAAAGETAGAKTDRALRRPTLPLVYASSCPVEGEAASPHIHAEDAMMATWIVLQTHRARAHRLLARIERTHPAAACLERFLP